MSGIPEYRGRAISSRVFGAEHQDAPDGLRHAPTVGDQTFDIRIMNDLTIEPVKSDVDATKLDVLLWEVLWKPLGLPRDVRESFKLKGEYLELVAKLGGTMVGGLVVYWTSLTDIELRHLAIRPEIQGHGVGSQLVKTLINIASEQNYRSIHAITRNASDGFFKKLGFKTVPGAVPQHPAFAKRGVTFSLMEYRIGP